MTGSGADLGGRVPTVAIVAGTSWYIWNFRRNVVKGFVDAGWKVVLIAPRDESTERLAAIQGTEFRDWSVSLDGAAVGAELASLWQLFRHLRASRPDFVLNNGIKANVYGGLACRFMRLAYANNVAGLGGRMARRGLGARALARLYAFATSGGRSVLIQNESDLEFLTANGLSGKVPVMRTMGSGVDLGHFAASPLPEGDRHFVFVGRLQRDKGIYDFVEAAQDLNARDPGAVFTVVGDLRHTNAGGVPESELEAWRKLGFIDFAGRQDDVRPWVKRAHVLVMPSHGGEGMPKIILEAAALGRPVITSDVPGCRDAVEQGKTGWLHAPADVAGLVATMEEVAALPLERLQEMGQAARMRAERFYSDEVVTRATLDLAQGAI